MEHTSSGVIDRQSSSPELLASPALHEVSHCGALLAKIRSTWSRRAQVRRQTDPELDSEIFFYPERDDFRTDLLPFKDHPYFLNAPSELQKKVLTCGWLGYNAKTFDIESKVITPACHYLMDGSLPADRVSRQICGETLVDEAYHVLLAMNACSMTREERGFHFLAVPKSYLVTAMEREQDRHAEKWKKVLVSFATAVVSEVFVSDYLKLLSADTQIQPLNRLTVSTHRQDELAHSSIFKLLAKFIYHQLNAEQKAFFAGMLPRPVLWFANSELEVWRSMLEQIRFPGGELMIKDCEVAESDLQRIDYSPIVVLASELGILDSPQGREIFEMAGLLKT